MGDPRSWGRTLSALSRIPQITIAAIDGACGGGGLELALACDLRAAGPGSEFSFPEVGLGLVPGGGGTQRLSRLIGPSRALAMIVSGDPMDPATAARVGLVDMVVGTSEGSSATDRVIEWAERIAGQPPASLRAAKQLVRESQSLPLDEGLRRESAAVRDLMRRGPAVALLERAVGRETLPGTP